jgi:hypothetical protein
VSSAISLRQFGSAEFNFIEDDLNIVLELKLVGVIVTKHGSNDLEGVVDVGWELAVGERNESILVWEEVVLWVAARYVVFQCVNHVFGVVEEEKCALLRHIKSLRGGDWHLNKAK